MEQNYLILSNYKKSMLQNSMLESRSCGRQWWSGRPPWMMASCSHGRQSDIDHQVDRRETIELHRRQPGRSVPPSAGSSREPWCRRTVCTVRCHRRRTLAAWLCRPCSSDNTCLADSCRGTGSQLYGSRSGPYSASRTDCSAYRPAVLYCKTNSSL